MQLPPPRLVSLHSLISHYNRFSFLFHTDLVFFFFFDPIHRVYFVFPLLFTMYQLHNFTTDTSTSARKQMEGIVPFRCYSAVAESVPFFFHSCVKTRLRSLSSMRRRISSLPLLLLLPLAYIRDWFFAELHISTMRPHARAPACFTCLRNHKQSTK